MHSRVNADNKGEYAAGNEGESTAVIGIGLPSYRLESRAVQGAVVGSNSNARESKKDETDDKHRTVGHDGHGTADELDHRPVREENDKRWKDMFGIQAQGQAYSDHLQGYSRFEAMAPMPHS